MFESLFLKYKRTILRTNFKKNLDNLDKITLAFLLVLIFLALLMCSSIITSLIISFELCNAYYLCITTICLLIIALMIVRMKYNQSKEKYINEQNKKAYSNMQEFVKFLVDNNISVTDSSSIDSLISLANEKREMTKETKSIFSGLFEAFKYFVIPVVTIVIKEYLTTDDLGEFLVRIILASVVPMIISFVIVLLAVNLKSILETDKQKIGWFVSDLIEVKCFNETATNMEKLYKDIKGSIS